MNWLSQVARGLRTFLGTQAELRQRLDLAARPWTQDQLHWAVDDRGEPVLHGSFLPTTPGRVTSRAGWCCCEGAAAAAALRRSAPAGSDVADRP